MNDMSADRVRRPTNITLDPDIRERLDEHIAKLPYRVGRSSIVEAAIIEYLDREAKKAKRR